MYSLSSLHENDSYIATISQLYDKGLRSLIDATVRHDCYANDLYVDKYISLCQLQLLWYFHWHFLLSNCMTQNSLIQNLDHGERLIFHNRNDSNSDGCHLLCGTIARYHLSSRIAESNLQNQDAWRHNKMILVDIPIWISTILHVDNLWIWLLIDQADMINCLCNEIMFSCEAFCNHQLSLTNIWHGRVMSMALDPTAVTWDIHQADPNEWVFDYLFILTCENIIH